MASPCVKEIKGFARKFKILISIILLILNGLLSCRKPMFIQRQCYNLALTRHVGMTID